MGKELLKINVGRQRQQFSKAFKLNAIKLLQAGQISGGLDRNS